MEGKGDINSIKDTVQKMDKMEQSQRLIQKSVSKIKGNNQVLKEALPDMDKQIELLEQQLAIMENVDLNAEAIIECLKPKDELSQHIVKYQSKFDAHNDVLFGLKSVDEIENMDQWLKTIKKISSK